MSDSRELDPLYPRALRVLGAALGSAALAWACGSTSNVAQRAPAPPTTAPPLEHDPIESPADEPGDGESPEESGAEPKAAGTGADTRAEQDAPAVAAPDADATSQAQPLGTVAGMPIFAEDLLLEWHQIAGREVLLVVDKVVTTRLAYAEAQRLGLRLAPEAVETRQARERRRLEETVSSFGQGFTVESYLESELGVEPTRYFERMRAATIRQMIAERVVRAWTLSNETVALRLIVVDSEEKMAEVQQRLADGADFGQLAREHSVDDTAEQGGYVPYLVRQERSPLARLAFSTAVGELGGPLATADHQFLIQVEERRGQVAGDWSSIGSRVAESLAQHPVSDAEFMHWKLAMELRYPIDLRRLEEILGTDS